jgi:NADPH-dependent 2,4-dienoyl-CoA reductase/sulfur reductase-like enzyme
MELALSQDATSYSIRLKDSAMSSSSAPLKIVVIGGSAAGPKAAARARRLDEHASITLIQKDPDLSMASCGYPYYIGGVFDDRNQLICTPAGIVRDPNFFEKAKRIEALVLTEAVAIDRAARTVTCRHLPSGETRVIPYDRLVIATGATPLFPQVPGTDLAGLHDPALARRRRPTARHP